MELKTLSPFARPYTSLIGIGERIHGKFLYKYMPLSTAIACLNNNSIRFREPYQWDDPFEKIYYLADYSNVMPDPEFDTKLLACCLTNKPNCEAAWRIYSRDSSNDPCVQFKIYLGQFRKFVEKYAKKISATVYEGRVNYGISDYEIRHLYQKIHRLYPVFFKDFNITKYLNLMILKRGYFEYENEIRFFINGHVSYNGYEDVKIPWSHCLDSVKLPPITDNVQAQKLRTRLEEALENNCELCKTEFPDLHTQVINTKPNTLYERIDPVTIE
jgi:hypothetical protein